MSFRIDAITLHVFSIPLLKPFRISAGVINNKDGIIVEVNSGVLTGWGEAAVDLVPFYAHETVGSVVDIYRNALGPLLLGRQFDHPDEVVRCMDQYRGNNFAKAPMDAAAWDIYGQMAGQPVWRLIGGTHQDFESGPSIGIKECPGKTVEAVAEILQEGDARIKLKVCPGKDFEFIRAVRERFPDVRLMVDANNAYDLERHAAEIARWDQFGLIMVEQPLDERDIYCHSLLRQRIKSPVCLDESIHTLHDADCCARMGAADIINIKVCRVGGLSHARRIHDLCQARGIRNWIGSRVGFGVANAARVAAATLPNCTLPSDCVLEGIYMQDDILETPFRRDKFRISAPDGPGLGIRVDRKKLARYTIQSIRL